MKLSHLWRRRHWWADAPLYRRGQSHLGQRLSASRFDLAPFL